MGAYASNFHVDSEGTVASFTSPAQPNWITAHAIATELAIPEVERLWSRFQQLGCDEYGVLPLTSPLPPNIEQDAFVRKILKSMKSNEDNVTFQSFLMALKWMESEKVDEKMRATFHLLNNGSPLDKGLLVKILKKVYPEDSEATVMRLSDVFFREMDSTGRGKITEDEFIYWVKRMPQETIDQLMDFHILPYDISHQASKQLSEFRDSQCMGGSLAPSRQADSRIIPSDELLEQVAEKIHQRDWILIGNKLGLQHHNIDSIRDTYTGDSKQQAFQMLLGWKQMFRNEAYISKLDTVLRSSSMTDAALLLPM